MIDTRLVRLACADGIATLTLNRAARHNALVPDLLDDLLTGLDAALSAGPRVLVLAAAGRSFSTGGDVAAFAALPRGARRRYAADLVGALNAAILALAAFPAPVIARVQGPITGGAVGLMLAGDIVLMARSAFVQSYHVAVGFAPDGGWTHLVPQRIGLTRASAAILGNERIDAQTAVTIGLASECVPDEELDDAVARWCGILAGMSSPALAAARRRLRDVEALAAALELERAAFLDLIETEAAEAGMARFLGGRR